MPHIPVVAGGALCANQGRLGNSLRERLGPLVSIVIALGDSYLRRLAASLKKVSSSRPCCRGLNLKFPDRLRGERFAALSAPQRSTHVLTTRDVQTQRFSTFLP